MVGDSLEVGTSPYLRGLLHGIPLTVDAQIRPVAKVSFASRTVFRCMCLILGMGKYRKARRMARYPAGMIAGLWQTRPWTLATR